MEISCFSNNNFILKWLYEERSLIDDIYNHYNPFTAEGPHQ